MKLTPLDIQQMVFKKSFRGYAHEEVERFLEDIAKTVEHLNREVAELREHLTSSERIVTELKKSEVTLSKTLVSAQTMGDELKHAAQRDAELIVKEAELKASEMVREARAELCSLHRDISDLRKQRLIVIERLRSTLRTVERTLEIEEEDVEEADSVERAGTVVRQANV